MIPVRLLLLLCAIVPQLSCLVNPSSSIVPHLSPFNYHTSTIRPLRTRLYDPSQTIVSALRCRDFNVEQKENMTRLRKFNITFLENAEIEVNRTMDLYREEEWKFGRKP